MRKTNGGSAISAASVAVALALCSARVSAGENFTAEDRQQAAVDNRLQPAVALISDYYVLERRTWGVTLGAL